MTFDNQLVKEISGSEGFVNQFDAVKIDTSARLPQVLRKNDVFVVNTGGGKHRFVRPIRRGYFPLDPIEDPPEIWPYKPGVLNGVGTSEAGALSIAFNNQVIQDFLFESRVEPVMVHLPRRTRVTFDYRIGDIPVSCNNLQIEMDFLLQGYPPRNLAGFIEAKSIPTRKKKNPGPAFDKLPDFAIAQLYLPYRRVHDLFPSRSSLIIKCAFLVAFKTQDGGDGFRLYEFTFDDPNDLSSIRCLKKREYQLKRRETLAQRKLTVGT